MVDIIQKENKVLRKKAQEVPLDKITSKKIKGVIEKMTEALYSQKDGIAIAAPQIGESLRIVVISGKILSILKNSKESTKDIILINPKIIKLSKEKEYMEEGCLSVRYLYGKVKRSKKSSIEAYNENGQKIKIGGSGILSQVFQHEIDHLNGVLFIDKAKDLEDIPPQHINE